MTQPKRKSVDNFETYEASEKPVEVSLSLSGAAGRSLRQLMTRLNTDDPNEVALRAIGLLVSATSQGKEILFRDPKTDTEEAVDI